MAVEAHFASDDSAVAECNTHLYIAIEELQNSANAVFPLTIITEYFQMKMKEIVADARKLSLRIQQGFVRSRLFVTAAPVKDDVMGTHAFGLDRVSVDGRVALIDLKALTTSQLENFPDS
jgi:hypothetical protein